MMVSTLVLIASQVQSQTNVKVKINHFLGGQMYSPNNVAENNLGHEFKVAYLRYYISDFTLYFDNGQDTTYLLIHTLANAKFTTEVDLGSINISQLDSIGFSIGVNQGYNHLDPSTYIASHPLAHQTPSMHWGWTPGYRFMAYEGTLLDEVTGIEIHALGDQNYFEQVHAINKTVTETNLVLEFDAEYQHVFDDIDITQGILRHGDTDEAVTALENMRDLVYTFKGATNSVKPVRNNAVETPLYPNPASAGQVLQIDQDDLGFIEFYNISGKLVSRSNGTSITAPENQGLYFVKAYNKRGEALNNSRLIVQ